MSQDILEAVDRAALAVSHPGKRMVSRHRMAARLLALGLLAVKHRGHRQVESKAVELCTCADADEGCSACPSDEERALLEADPDEIVLPEVGAGKRTGRGGMS